MYCESDTYFNGLSLLLGSDTWRKHSNLNLLKPTVIQIAGNGMDCENREKILASDLSSSEKPLFILSLPSCFLGSAVLILMATTVLAPQIET